MLPKINEESLKITLKSCKSYYFEGLKQFGHKLLKSSYCGGQLVYFGQSKRHLGCLSGRLGSLLGRFLAPRAALGRPLGVCWLLGTSGQPPGRFLGSYWAVLEASWVPFGWLLGRLGHQVGASWGGLEASWKRLGRIFAPKWNQVGIKIC